MTTSAKGPLNPPDGYSMTRKLPPPVGKLKSAVFPNIPEMGRWAGEKVSSVGAAELREARLCLLQCLTSGSTKKYKKATVFPDLRPIKADVVADIKLLLDILHQQGPADLLVIEKMAKALEEGMSAEEIGDKFKVPIHELRDPTAGTHESYEAVAVTGEFPAGLKKLAAAAVMALQVEGPARDAILAQYKAMTVPTALKVLDQTKGLFK